MSFYIILICFILVLTGLLLAYSRASLSFLTINLKKIDYWSEYLQTNYGQIYTKLDEIREQLYNIQILTEQNDYLIPQINADDDKLNESIVELVKKHQLKFKYKWNFWGYYESIELFEYLINTPKGWKLNEKTLKQIDNHFENKFATDFLKLKCYEYGFEYFENTFD